MNQATEEQSRAKATFEKTMDELAKPMEALYEKEQTLAILNQLCDQMALPIRSHMAIFKERIQHIQNMGFFEFAGPSNLFGIAKDQKGKTFIENELDDLTKIVDRSQLSLAKIEKLKQSLADGSLQPNDLPGLKKLMGQDLLDTPEGRFMVSFIEKIPQGEQFSEQDRLKLFYDFYLSKGHEYKGALGDMASRTSDQFFDQARKIAKEQLKDPKFAAEAEAQISSRFEKFRRDYLATYAEPFVQWDSLALMAISGPIGKGLSKIGALAKWGVRAEAIAAKAPTAVKIAAKALPGVEVIGSEAMIFGRKIPTLIKFLPNFAMEMGKFMAYEAAAQKIGGEKFGKAVAYLCMLVPGMRAGFERGITSRADYLKLLSENNPKKLEAILAARLESFLPPGEPMTPQLKKEIKDMANGIVKEAELPQTANAPRPEIQNKASIKAEEAPAPKKVTANPAEPPQLSPEARAERQKGIMEKLDPVNRQLDAQNRTAEQETMKRLAEGLEGKNAAEFKEAFIDPMTGLLNRQGLRLLDQWIVKGERVSLVSYDGDHFSAYNKVIGRDLGDLIIKHMSTEFHEMMRRLRAKGFKAEAIRMGGEEFVVISDAPKATLAAEMDRAASSLQTRIRSLFDSDMLNELATHISAGKYQNEANGAQRALREIGGSSSGVSEVKLYSQTEGVKARQDLLQYVDEFLEHGKAQERGKTHVDSRDLARASSDVARFRPTNRLTEAMNDNLAVLRSELDDEVAKLQQSKTPITAELFKSHPEQRTLLEEYLKSPTSDPHLRNRILQEAKIGIERLEAAKQESIRAIRDHGTYSGADTVRFLERQLAQGGFDAPRRLVVGEFKSINEIMGHTFGDTVLTYVHQRIIQEAVRLEGLAGKVIVAQDKADFLVAFSRDVSPEIRARFEQNIVALYNRRIQDLFMRIDTGRVEPVESVRKEWIQKNKSSTLQQSLDAMYSMTIE